MDYDKVTGRIATNKCPEANLKKVALVRNENRLFETQVNITDAQYVYRDMGDFTKFPTYDGCAYFFYLLPEKKYVGKTGTGKQFNCACHEHQ